MREIKFRAWDTVQEKLLPVERINFREDVISLDEGDNSVSDSSEMFILMQYTGLKDKNGIEIYEGDFVKGAHRANEEWVKLQEVNYSKGCFMFGNWNAHEYFNKHTYIEIIGNIYANPELLEAKHD